MKNRAVVVTGASSGIGRATALRLARAGFRVFAGVRKAADGQSLMQQGEGRIEPLVVDVTVESSVDSAADYLTRALRGEGLYALVNNAGIGSSGPLEFQTQEELRQVFDVNVFGAVAMTQALLPLIRLARGRIVNIGSIGDRFTVPFGGALCASKSAIRSLTEALRLEVHQFGVHVALVQPTSISTPAVTKFGDEARARIDALPADAALLYGDSYRAFVKRAMAEEKHGSPPEVVADAVHRALTDRTPRTRYLAGKHKTLMSLLPAVVPDRALDVMRLLLFGMPLAFGAKAAISAVRSRQRDKKAPAGS